MRIAVLCPGPSLRETYGGPGGFDAVIAVNAAAERYVADWWVCLDAKTFGLFQPVGTPRLLTYRHTAQQLKAGGHAERFGRHFSIDDDALAGMMKPPMRVATYSATAAITLAGGLGATAIEVFGADMTGDMDYLGRRCMKGRTERRWTKEAALFADLHHWLSDRGIEVVRHERERHQPAA